MCHSESIDKILKSKYRDKNKRKQAKENIANIIVGIIEDRTQRILLHSELDADRLDYLLRDSAFTGVGYGHIELDYMISRMQIVTDAQVFDALRYFHEIVDGVEYISNLKEEAQKIARDIAHELDLCPERVKADLRDEPIMKYTEMIEEREGPNREAVRICHERDGKDYPEYAAKSNASILGKLIDHKLLIFNVY